MGPKAHLTLQPKKQCAIKVGGGIFQPFLWAKYEPGPYCLRSMRADGSQCRQHAVSYLQNKNCPQETKTGISAVAAIRSAPAPAGLSLKHRIDIAYVYTRMHSR